jgi:hypothetical protein
VVEAIWTTKNTTLADGRERYGDTYKTYDYFVLQVIRLGLGPPSPPHLSPSCLARGRHPGFSRRPGALLRRLHHVPRRPAALLRAELAPR